SDYLSWVETYWDVRLGLISTGTEIKNENIHVEDLLSGLRKFIDFFSDDFEYCHSVIERLMDQVQSINHENQIDILTQLFDVLSQKNEERWKELIQKILERIYYSLSFHHHDLEHQKKREKWIHQVLEQGNHHILDQFFQSGSM